MALFNILDIFTSRKIVFDDQHKTILKSPKWLKYLYIVLSVFKILFFIYWLLNATSDLVINLLQNFPRIFGAFIASIHVRPLNKVMLILTILFIFDIYEIVWSNKTIIINKETRVIYQKGFYKTKMYRLSEGPFYIIIKKKGLNPNFTLFLTHRKTEKYRPFSNTASLFTEVDLFSVSQRDPKYQTLLHFLKESGVKVK